MYDKLCPDSPLVTQDLAGICYPSLEWIAASKKGWGRLYGRVKERARPADGREADLRRRFPSILSKTFVPSGDARRLQKVTRPDVQDDTAWPRKAPWSFRCGLGGLNQAIRRLVHNARLAISQFGISWVGLHCSFAGSDRRCDTQATNIRGDTTRRTPSPPLLSEAVPPPGDPNEPAPGFGFRCQTLQWRRG